MSGSKFCHCALPALRGLDVCKDCVNNKVLTHEEAFQAIKDLEKETDLANDEQHLKDLENEKYGRPSWEDTYFEIAKVISKRSKDPHTKVGAVLVKDGCVIGLGYNGEPRNFNHEFDWNSSEKYDFVIHAELNAIANACAVGANVNGASLYITLSPCHDCMKLIIQHRIKEVFYLEEYRDIELSKMMAEAANVKLIKY